MQSCLHPHLLALSSLFVTAIEEQNKQNQLQPIISNNNTTGSYIKHHVPITSASQTSTHQVYNNVDINK